MPPASPHRFDDPLDVAQRRAECRLQRWQRYVDDGAVDEGQARSEDRRGEYPRAAAVVAGAPAALRIAASSHGGLVIDHLGDHRGDHRGRDHSGCAAVTPHGQRARGMIRSRGRQTGDGRPPGLALRRRSPSGRLPAKRRPRGGPHRIVRGVVRRSDGKSR